MIQTQKVKVCGNWKRQIREKEKKSVHLKGREEARDEHDFRQACPSWNCVLNLDATAPLSVPSRSYFCVQNLHSRCYFN